MGVDDGLVVNGVGGIPVGGGVAAADSTGLGKVNYLGIAAVVVESIVGTGGYLDDIIGSVNSLNGCLDSVIAGCGSSAVAIGGDIVNRDAVFTLGRCRVAAK